MTDRPDMFAPTTGFSGMADSMEPCTMLWGRPLLPWQRNLGKFGLFFDKIAITISGLVCQIDRICLGLPGETTRGPIFVAMAMTFALGAESNHLPACLFVCLFVSLLARL